MTRIVRITDHYWILDSGELRRSEVGTVVINVADMLRAIKEYCPKEWREAIQSDLDDDQFNRELSNSLNS